MKNNKIINTVFGGIILLGILVRLYHFDAPIADWHSWRQADTSAVSRNFVKEGFDILHPRFDDLSNVPSGTDNPQGYRFVEFPLFNIIQAGGYVLFNVFTLEEWGRLVSISASVLAMTFIFLLTRRHFNSTAALFSAFFYAVIPYSVYYGRTILPDVSMTAAILGGIYFFDRWAESSSKDLKIKYSKQILFYCLSLVFTAAALLLKPYALFFTLPLLYLAFSYFGFSFLKKWQLWLYLIVGLVPLVLWRIWMTQYPEGVPSNVWLFNAGDIRFKGAYFFWIFADRIGRLILGYWGIGLFVVGLVTLLQKEFLGSIRKGKAYFFISFLLATLLYLVVIARGNVQHDYYQILIIPTIAMLLGIGASNLMELPKKIYYPFTGISIILLCSIFMLMFGWYHIRDFYNINNPAIIRAGQAVDKLTPKNAKVLANYNGDTTFLYQTNRQGWASYTYDMPEMVKLGASYLVLVHPQDEEIARFSKDYPIVERTDEFILFDLQP